MTFDEWYWTYCQKKKTAKGDRNEAAAFLNELNRTAAEAAWIAGRLFLREELSRKVRDIELEARKDAQK